MLIWCVTGYRTKCIVVAEETETKMIETNIEIDEMETERNYFVIGVIKTIADNG